MIHVELVFSINFSCADFPDWIISFENVITILPDAGVSYSVYYRTHDHTTGSYSQKTT